MKSDEHSNELAANTEYVAANTTDMTLPSTTYANPRQVVLTHSNRTVTFNLKCYQYYV